MPTKIVVDLATGQTKEVELSGDELAAYEASLAAQAAQAPAEITTEQA
jgi:hypothetical protein